MENDFLDAHVAQPEQRPEVSDRLAKLASFAMISVLDFLPSAEGVHISLVLKREGHNSPQAESVFSEDTSVDEALAHAREHMEKDSTIEAYALVIDSQSKLAGFPDARPVDECGQEYPPDQPVAAMYAGERDEQQGILVVQPYRRRFFRGGATPVGAPLIVQGPDSLLAFDGPCLPQQAQ